MKKEAKIYYNSLLIGNETKEEKRILYQSLLEAISWGRGFKSEESNANYFSDLSLDENLKAISYVFEIEPVHILTSIKRNCIMAKNILVYISSKKYSFNDISNFIGKKKDKTINMYKSIEDSLDICDLEVTSKIFEVCKYIEMKR